MIPTRELRPPVYVHLQSVAHFFRGTGSHDDGRFRAHGRHPIVLALVVVPVLGAVAPEADAELDGTKLGGRGRRAQGEREGIELRTGLDTARREDGLDVRAAFPLIERHPQEHLLIERYVLHLDGTRDGIVPFPNYHILQGDATLLDFVAEGHVIRCRLRELDNPLDIRGRIGLDPLHHLRQKLICPLRGAVGGLGHHLDVCEGQSLVVREPDPLLAVVARPVVFGHEAGADVVLEVLHGGVEVGVPVAVAEVAVAEVHEGGREGDGGTGRQHHLQVDGHSSVQKKEGC